MLICKIPNILAFIGSFAGREKKNSDSVFSMKDPL